MPAMTRLVESLTPHQRTMLDFVAPGHPYWNEQTLADTQLRYPNMDLRPYRQALEDARGAVAGAAGAGAAKL